MQQQETPTWEQEEQEETSAGAHEEQEEQDEEDENDRARQISGNEVPISFPTDR